MGTAPTIALYRGHTHGEIALMPNAPVGTQIGEWYRDVLAEKEYIPEGWRWDPIRQMRTFNHAHWEFKRIFCSYDRKSNRLHVPIAFCDQAKQVLENFGCEVKEIPLPSYPLRKISLGINPKYTDLPHQVELIKKCSEPTFGMKGLAMQTGRGKSYSATKSALNLGYATIVIAPNSLPNQWYKDLYEKTTAKKGDVYKIEGFDSLATLAKCPTYQPSIFVASIRTMQLFMNGDNGYDLLPWTYTKFFETYGIGTKIVDECHLNFHANTMMDLRTNVPYNLYCSATFDQTNKFCKRIFDKVFPEEIRYGMEKYDKYVTVYWIRYSGEVDERKCCRQQKYMHLLYERELLKSKGKLDTHVNTVIVPPLNQFYVNVRKPGQKCLIFCSSVDFISAVVKNLRAKYPDLVIEPYTGESDDSVLTKADVMVSTVGKAGTGLDIKGLILCINTVSIRTPVLTSQMLGRLRKISGMDLVYVDNCDINMRAHCRHAETRKEALRSMALKFYEYYGWNDMRVY